MNSQRKQIVLVNIDIIMLKKNLSIKERAAVKIATSNI